MVNIKLFQDKVIRFPWDEEKELWCFVVEDEAAALNDSAYQKHYFKRIIMRKSESAKGWKQFHTVPPKTIYND